MKEPTCRVCKTANHVELQWVCEQCGGRDTAMDVEDEITQLTERAEEFQNLAQMNQSEIDRLRARVVELEKDKARLDWLEQRDTVKAFNRPGVVPLWYCGVDGDIRAAIDAAKGGER